MSFAATNLIGFMGGGEKPFSAVSGTNTGGTALASTYDVPLPSSISAGNLLLMFITGRTNVARSFTTPTGWSELYNVVGSSNLRRAVCYYRTADGTEGSTVTVNASGGIVYSTITYCISGAGTTPEAATASGSSSGPDSPSLSPSWGTANTLFISASHGHINTATNPTIPSGYTNGVFKAQLDGSYSVVDTAELSSAAASEDPGAWAYASSGAWVAATVAIGPA